MGHHIPWQELEKQARAAARQAYVPYSRFAVGAALLTSDGRIVRGCNVENASYGLTNCAERTAIFSARADGMSEVLAVCIYTPTSAPTPPCGACRQVLNEFGPGMAIRAVCDGTERIDTTLDVLLPGAFGPMNLA
ncbi:cytidine deaminase [Vogesella sp. LIG4]|uniref:cytidine deaminase n=1 Tax=Vogesella sp. LIG4 TaxID=1192162 RepID=UPI00081FF841|nr:cytidine deaminase [Vogesella sp. LIG4]SCK26907.1 cytidine deaminase [Vogesella sp. LIG4]